MQTGEQQAEEIKERLDYFKNHLIHLNENAHRLNFDFVEEERVSLDKIISDLEKQLANKQK
jgi:hypothetical protein